MKNSVIYSLKPIFADSILKREKLYEFRKIIPQNIPKFIWFYVSAPESKLMYLAEVGEIIKYPNTIVGLEEGEFAYPITHFHKIKEPINLNDLKSKFGFSAPQSFAYLDKYKKLQNYLLNKAILEKIY